MSDSSTTSNLPLAGRVALVTGAGSGIGRAIAVELSRLGATLCLAARSATALNQTGALLTTQWHAYPGDLTDDAHVASLPAAIARDAGGLDILIHCAAAYHQAPLESTPIEELDNQYRTNLRAPFLLTQKLLPLLKARRGQIFFINSTTGTAARPNVSAYAATKHALKGMADCLRQEVTGIVRIISIYPGQTATPMQEKRYATENRPYRPEQLVQPEEVAKMIGAVACLPPTAEVTDLQIKPAVKS